jgi:hypothetical protein
MWAPLVARTTSRRYSSSCHVLWSMSAGTAEIAFLIRVFRSSRHLLAAKKKNFQSFTVICRKPHVASSICLRATIFQNPEGTLWTHCIFIYIVFFCCWHVNCVDLCVIVWINCVSGLVVSPEERKQFASGTQCFVLSIFMIIDKILVNFCWYYSWMEPFLYSPIRLRGVILN